MRQRSVIFDLSRLATRFSRATPNGIDRVDLGYAQHFLSETRGGQGAIIGPVGVRAVDNCAARNVVSAIVGHWRERGRPEDDQAYLRLMARLEGGSPGTIETRESTSAAPSARRSIGRLFREGNVVGARGLFPGRSITATVPEGAVYLNTSQFPLWLDWYFRWLDRRRDVKAVFFVHDLLPITHPEFFPPAEAQRHTKRLEVLAHRSAGLIVASEQTRCILEANLRRRGFAVPPICVLPLPVASVFSEPEPVVRLEGRGDYFVVLGTIEPRKNHLLLLNIWRELVEHLGTRTPTLVLVGARGWDNENVVDMLERCHAIKPYVIETAGLSSPALKRVMTGARAVLLPTFAEGYGLPVAEACAAGVRVILSNIMPLKAHAGVRSTLVDPLDGPKWRDAIMAHLSCNAPAMADDLTPRNETTPTWAWHIHNAEKFLHSL